MELTLLTKDNVLLDVRLCRGCFLASQKVEDVEDVIPYRFSSKRVLDYSKHNKYFELTPENRKAADEYLSGLRKNSEEKILALYNDSDKAKTFRAELQYLDEEEKVFEVLGEEEGAKLTKQCIINDLYRKTFDEESEVIVKEFNRAEAKFIGTMIKEQRLKKAIELRDALDAKKEKASIIRDRIIEQRPIYLGENKIGVVVLFSDFQFGISVCHQMDTFCKYEALIQAEKNSGADFFRISRHVITSDGCDCDNCTKRTREISEVFEAFVKHCSRKYANSNDYIRGIADVSKLIFVK